MRAFVAPTDRRWFDFLSAQPNLDEVNFWKPMPGRGSFRALRLGELFLFKLKHPFNAIAGGGRFAHFTRLPVSRAWDEFGFKNGAASLDVVRDSISRLRYERPRDGADYTIGCVLLVEPFFWPESDWIPQPADWKPTIVQGRGYDLSEGVGREIWEAVQKRLSGAVARGRVVERQNFVVAGGYGDPLLVRPRLGQGTFRAMVTDAYERRCAITTEGALPVLDAAHIRPFSHMETHSVSNGLLLRADVHRLFDAGYLTITPEYHVETSPRMSGEFGSGENYQRLHGRKIFVPAEPKFRPDPEILRWHNNTKFLR